MKLGAKQKAVLQEGAEKEYVARLSRYLRKDHAEAVKDLADDLLKERIATGIRRARAYGFTWETTIAIFVTFMFTVAPNFDDHPRIRKILQDRQIPANDRIDALLEKTTEQDWEAAKQSADERA